MVKLVVGVLFLGLVFQLVVSTVDIDSLNIWPMPHSVSYGHQVLYMSKDFELRTEGSKYPDASGILKDGFSRLLYVIRASHVVDGNVSDSQQSLVLQGINVLISSADDELQYGIDESYKLSITSSGDPVYAHLEAQTVYGALHGLQTFSQLCQFNFHTRLIEVRQTPWDISDQPRFPYRGLLIDTSRHYLPLPIIKKVVDSMTYTKLNVLHWHIVDSQSFPLEIPSYPKLWNGAYSIPERYTMADAAEVVSYAQRRGINVLAEIDVPGHAQSWGTDYPTLWPSQDCQQPLDVSNEFTFQVIDGILSDLSKVFKFKYVHLGGDEVNTNCWVTTPHVNDWLQKQGMNASQAYEYFVLRAQEIALSHGYECINWEETFRTFGDKLNRKTVVHNWLDVGTAARVVAAGLRCIVSRQDKWYLDHLNTFWPEFYSYEPLTNITDPKQQELVIGGEVCMWGETVDGSDIEQTIWPRAAAAAERLWTPYEKLAKDPAQVIGRLTQFRCLLNQRGVAAAPLTGYGRGAPHEPGSCYMQ
ncbi:beta-hexosaminidase 3-like isoform X2 [Rhododendron vialii]|uniref:beta-hexosaminidase 3-like isoform X2 n=1 Tax=Rhododendron vialii TaxID=182163 RepID=UPI0026605AE0|nr:beta-hexosaminidase 3-like isoform X2 [Rhododendron vialii]